MRPASPARNPLFEPDPSPAQLYAGLCLAQHDPFLNGLGLDLFNKTNIAKIALSSILGLSFICEMCII